MKRSFTMRRVLAAAAAAVVVAGGVAWQRGAFRTVGPRRGSNALMVIAPYRHAGTWVFDDPDVGLKREPFIAGTPELIDKLVADIPGAQKGFRLTFSAREFPGHDDRLVWRRGDASGNWYFSERFQAEGWLCPALFKYFAEAPKAIYVKADAR